MAVRTKVIALLALAVLLAHTAAIDWLAQQWQPIALKALPKPMYTRQIVPAPPQDQKSVPNVPDALVQRSRPAITSIAKQPPVTVAKKRAPKPEPAASAAVESAAAERPAGQPPAERTAAASDLPAKLPRPAASGAPAAPDPGLAVGATPPAERAASEADSVAIAARTEPGATESAAPPQATSTRDGNDPLPDWPSDTRLSYELGGYYRGELHGSAQVLWQRDGNDYQAMIEIDLGLLANLKLTSQGRITVRGLEPRVYEELQRTRRRGVRLEDGIIVLEDGRRVDRPARVQDTASQFVELAHRFATGRIPLEEGRTISLWLARPGGVDSWTYDVVGRVMLPTPTLGAVEAFHLKPRPLVKPDAKYSAEIWFAPSLQYLPVKIRVSMKNDEAWVDLVVKRIDQK